RTRLRSPVCGSLTVYMTPEQEQARKNKLVSAAKGVVSGQVGITVGCHRIENCLYHLGEKWQKENPMFSSYLQQFPMDMPIGSERLLWSLDKILETDSVLAQIEFNARQQIMEACVAIIKNH